jgi:hypothetical protein
MLKISTEFHNEYMKSVEERLKVSKDILDGKGNIYPDIELAKNP